MNVGRPGPTTEHLDDDLLMDLAHGLLQKDLIEDSLDHLRRCPPCDERFRVEMRSRERTRAAGIPAFEGIGPAARPDAAREGSRLGLFARWRFAAIAAAAVVVLLAVVVPRAGKDRSAGAPYWLPLDRGEITLFRSPSPSDSLAEMRLALQAYDRRDAAAALTLLERASVPESYRALRDLFRASALLHLDRPGDARLVLEGMRIHGMPEPWRDRAQWLLYQALRRTGERDRAEALRAALASTPGEIAGLATAEGDRLRASGE